MQGLASTKGVKRCEGQQAKIVQEADGSPKEGAQGARDDVVGSSSGQDAVGADGADGHEGQEGLQGWW